MKDFPFARENHFPFFTEILELYGIINLVAFSDFLDFINLQFGEIGSYFRNDGFWEISFSYFFYMLQNFAGLIVPDFVLCSPADFEFYRVIIPI